MLKVQLCNYELGLFRKIDGDSASVPLKLLVLKIGFVSKKPLQTTCDLSTCHWELALFRKIDGDNASVPLKLLVLKIGFVSKKPLQTTCDLST